MLDASLLKESLTIAFQEGLKEIFEKALKATLPDQTVKGDKICTDFGEAAASMAEPLATRVAYAIDSYVRNISLTATFMSTPCSPGTPLVFRFQDFGSRIVTNAIGTSGLGPTGMGAIMVL